ncbi:MAG: uncharacterized protein QOE33_910 [Acidobacteriota bacterium]|nr:uncharacterized protein [Acidobacteriota bacterium]
MDFDWDAKKAARNLKEHRISFKEAATIFGDPLARTFDDPDHSLEEQRFITIGVSGQGTLLIVAHSDRGDTTRIISARETTRGERKLYEEEI